ncbi:MAG TPA: LytR C-terminal domain-containing protein [Longimicrobiales bacterium]|nr:LytR C-terminal domain-containing protein [Longimicrobiales bacterium]
MARSGAGTRRGARVVLFVTLGMVAAFAVSLVARILGDGSGAAAGAAALGDPAQVRVEVLNRAGTAGLARDATHRLRGDGFDVVYFGNAPAFDRGRSVVLDRVRDPLLARAVAASLGIDSVATAPDSTLLLDVTVMLGDDWPPRPLQRKGLVERLRGVLEE